MRIASIFETNGFLATDDAKITILNNGFTTSKMSHKSLKRRRIFANLMHYALTHRSTRRHQVRIPQQDQKCHFNMLISHHRSTVSGRRSFKSHRCLNQINNSPILAQTLTHTRKLTGMLCLLGDLSHQPNVTHCWSHKTYVEWGNVWLHTSTKQSLRPGTATKNFWNQSNQIAAAILDPSKQHRKSFLPARLRRRQSPALVDWSSFPWLPAVQG